MDVDESPSCERGLVVQFHRWRRGKQHHTSVWATCGGYDATGRSKLTSVLLSAGARCRPSF